MTPSAAATSADAFFSGGYGIHRNAWTSYATGDPLGSRVPPPAPPAFNFFKQVPLGVRDLELTDPRGWEFGVLSARATCSSGGQTAPLVWAKSSVVGSIGVESDVVDGEYNFTLSINCATTTGDFDAMCSLDGSTSRLPVFGNLRKAGSACRDLDGAGSVEPIAFTVSAVELEGTPATVPVRVAINNLDCLAPAGANPTVVGSLSIELLPVYVKRLDDIDYRHRREPGVSQLTYWPCPGLVDTGNEATMPQTMPQRRTEKGNGHAQHSTL